MLTDRLTGLKIGLSRRLLIGNWTLQIQCTRHVGLNSATVW